MSSYRFACRSCGWTADSTDRSIRCPDCQSRIEVSIETWPTELVTNPDRYDIYRYGAWLPTDDIEQVTAGEGWTPIVEAPALATAANGSDESTDGSRSETSVFIKNETVNPTWSWKDRMAALVVPHLVADGADRIATSTTGNHGSAIAAYAAQAGVDRILVFVNSSSEPPHHAQIRAYGAESIELTDSSYAPRLLGELADQGWAIAYPFEETYTGQQFVFEGYKTIAYEIVEQYGVPDAVVAAVGAGDGLYGTWKGFRELEAAGLIDEPPAMVSAEAAERHPLGKAVENEADGVGNDPGPEPLSTSTKSPTTGDHALAAVSESGGRPTVIDRDLLERATKAAGQAGVFLEPASALAAGGAAQLAATGDYDSIIAIGSGAGSSWPQKTSALVGKYPTVEPNLEAVAAAVPFSLE